MNRCLYCYKELQNGEHDYHKSCVRKFYGSYEVPEIPYSRNIISQLAKELVLSRTTVTGVQPKLSLHLSRGGQDEPDKLTLVDLWGTHNASCRIGRHQNGAAHPCEDGRRRALLPYTSNRPHSRWLKNPDGRYLPAHRTSDRGQISFFVRTDCQDDSQTFIRGQT